MLGNSQEKEKEKKKKKKEKVGIQKTSKRQPVDKEICFLLIQLKKKSSSSPFQKY